MNQPNIEKLQGKPRILVVPLDWGLGHATRCIPIIKEFLKQSCDVWLAGENAQEHLLKEEFPDLPFLQLPGYRITYAKSKSGLLWKMIQQGPKMKRAIQFEHNWLKKIVDEHKIDVIISDNRYGLHHSKIPGIFITHQLRIISPIGKWTENILQKNNYKYIKEFKECWIPDFESEVNLAGKLSHPELKPTTPLHYIGLLSRLEKEDEAAKSREEKKNHLLVILSGPEPQRSILEEKIVEEISHYNGTATVVRGLPGVSSIIPSTNMIKFYNHLSAAAINEAMKEAEYVICRSGYSSVMDLAAMQKKSILIPTPGQTEQEYLATYLLEKKMAFSTTQCDFSLSIALKKAIHFNYKLPDFSSKDLLTTAIQRLLGMIR